MDAQAVLLSQHFTLEEFCDSSTADRRGIANVLPASLHSQAQDTVDMLERIRAFLTRQADHPVPMVITSGYRCLELNRAIGSSDTSDHIKAMAADWRAPAFGTPYDVCKALAPHVSALGIGQLIHEFGSWIHTSTRTPAKPVNRVITVSQAGTSLGIQRV